MNVTQGVVTVVAEMSQCHANFPASNRGWCRGNPVDWSNLLMKIKVTA
jgi:hypothetical protein